jgi:sterol desaturase/sphingolipid hydroxylase (fatty acid hydroxylase superfamily)
MWTGLLAVPLFFTFGKERYEDIFPKTWYVTEPTSYYPFDRNNLASPVGLSLGIFAVIVGQQFVLAYFYLKRHGYFGKSVAVQKEGARKYDWAEGVTTHLSQPEGFVLLGGYLIGTWMFGVMPSTYYSFGGGINYVHVFAQLLLTDFLQYLMHLGEHKIHPTFYQVSHKPHHRFTNPRLFDAFNGSLFDTIFMILIPLYITALLVPANVWSYMAFGSLYANWLVLIHAEYHHVWDNTVFRHIGFGTSGDHHVHHKLFIFNYGHLFTYWDRLFGTYKSPLNVDVFTDIGGDRLEESSKKR